MTKLQAFYQRTAKLEEFVILAYAVAVYLPITYTWIVLIAGIVVFVLRAILEAVLKKQRLPLSYSSAAACPPDATAAAYSSERAESAALADGCEPGSAGFQPASHRSESTCSSIKSAPFAIPLLVFTLVVFLTGYCKGGISEAFASVVTLRAFLIYFIAYRAFRRSDWLLAKSLMVLLTAGAIAGIYGAYQQVFNYHPGYPYLQASGFVDHPMAYAGQMETTACLSLGLLLSGGWRFVLKHKAAFAVITICNLAGVFYASERSAWLGMLFAILLMSSLISIRTFAKVVVGLAVVGVLSWFFVPVVQTRIMPMLTNIKSDVGVQARFVIWKQSFDIWKEHPVVGVGPRDFPKIDIPEAIIPGESTHLVHAHCNILHMMATMGTVGVLAFLYLELSTLLVAVRTWFSKNENLFHRAIGLSVLGGIVSLMVAGLFEYNFGTGHVRLMHWFVLAMLLGLSKTRPAAPADASESTNV